MFVVVHRNNCDDLAQKESKGFMANLTSNSSMTKSYHTRHHRNRHKNPYSRHKMLKRKVDMRDFEILKVLGTGAYGKASFVYSVLTVFSWKLILTITYYRCFLFAKLAALTTESCTQ